MCTKYPSSGITAVLGLRAVLTEVLAFANCTPPYLITRSQWNQQKVFPELTQSMLKLAVEQLIIWNKLFGEVPSQRVCQIEVKGVCEDYVVYTVHCTGQLGVHLVASFLPCATYLQKSYLSYYLKRDSTVWNGQTQILFCLKSVQM